MLNNSTNKGEASEFSPVTPEADTMADSTVEEEIVIYDECGDTLWDRVLRQEDKIKNPEQETSAE